MPTTRLVTVTSPIDSDAGELFLLSMHSREALGQLFSYQLELISEKTDLKCADLIGKSMTVHLATQGETRHFNGVIAHFSCVGSHGQYGAYRAILRPWLWLLSLQRNNQVFQRMSVPELAQFVFRDNGFSDVEPTQLSGEYDKQEYVLQYQETTFNFVSRWLEREGIFYSFKHYADAHKLCMADDSTAGQKVPQYEEIPYLAPTEAGRHEADHFSEWRETANVISDHYIADAYDFKKPSAVLQAAADPPGATRMARRFIYDATPFYTEAAAGQRYATTHAEALRAGEVIFEGSGNVRGLSPGSIFKLTGHYRESYNRTYCVISVDCAVQAGEFESRHGGGGGSHHVVHTQIRAIDASTLFRPARSAVWPVVGGLESAVVVGDKGSEIHTDEYGRIRVQFHWDTVGKYDQDSSCYIRVAQPWAGAGFGTQFIPRVGQEVLVHFMNGDPDQPVVIGSAYNGEHKLPFPTHKHRTQTGIRTRSTKQGSLDQYNELCFDDAKGAEQLKLRAQRDMTTTVNHDSTISVGNDETHNVQQNLSTTVASGDYKIEVKEGFMSVLVHADHSVAARSVHETADEEIQMRLKMLPVEITLQSTGIRLSVPGSSISIATEGIEITSAGSSIKVTPAGVEITGLQVSMNGAA